MSRKRIFSDYHKSARKDAIEKKERLFSGDECVKCGCVLRYSTSGQCRDCLKATYVSLSESDASHYEDIVFGMDSMSDGTRFLLHKRWTYEGEH